MEPAEYGTWVTSEQLRPLPGVDLGGIPAHPRTRTPAPARWAWLLDGRTHGRPATVHAEGCSGATDRAHPLGTMQALDVLARPGTIACTVCGAAEALLPILAPAGTTGPPPATDQVGVRRGPRWVLRNADSLIPISESPAARRLTGLERHRRGHGVRLLFRLGAETAQRRGGGGGDSREGPGDVRIDLGEGGHQGVDRLDGALDRGQVPVTGRVREPARAVRYSLGQLLTPGAL
ncbi:DUF6233 domain-containing protein [Streptomyces nojiriensis]|uniref:DUF6233 domain-containing protein n=1 Tax=Streptomyces nojiriensis TaxID=66374 RepID=UPI0035DC43D7